MASRRHLILDSGALIAAARGDRSVRERLYAAVAFGDEVVVPSVVLAETVRGGAQDAVINRIANNARVTPADEPIARAAGALLANAHSNATVDALVAATAIAHGPSILVTGDVTDLTVLLSDCREVVQDL